ncbi:MAG: chalcone isomerase family protein [Parachlamydiaceae bacterium]
MIRFFIYMILCFLPFFSERAHGEDSFPLNVAITKDNQTFHMQLTGVAKRKKLFIHIYNVASYLDVRADKNLLLEEIMNDRNAKQLVVKWVHDAGRKRIIKGYNESFLSDLSKNEYLELSNSIAQYLSFITDVRAGDEHIVRWLPGGMIETYINGEFIGTILDEKFAKALWGLWFNHEKTATQNSLLTLGLRDGP